MLIPNVVGVVVAALVAALLGGQPMTRLDTPEQGSKTSTVDLVQTQLVLPGKLKIGKTFQVLDELENAGEYLAPASVTYFYLSEDNKLDSSDVPVGGRRVPPLPASRSHSAVSPVVLRPPVKPGTYYFIAMADGERAVEERYKQNNTRAVKVTVQPADPEKK